MQISGSWGAHVGTKGGSEMELLSSQQEIICLIKDFPLLTPSANQIYYSTESLKWSKGHPGFPEEK